MVGKFVQCYVQPFTWSTDANKAKLAFQPHGVLYLEWNLTPYYMVAPQAVHRPLPYVGKETITKESGNSVSRDGTDMPTLVP